jgi:catechol 2,3-dioxygenase-like lactoylglutathione lyase family enzyme
LKLNKLTPMLLASDLEETIAFYTDVLGFTLVKTLEDPPTWCSLQRDGVGLMFVWAGPPHEHEPGEEHDHPSPGITGVLYISPDDVTALHDEIDGRWQICEELGVRPHGMLEFAVLDPNGYRLRFGGPP